MKDIIDSLGAYPIIQFAVVVAIALIAVPIAMRAIRDKGRGQSEQGGSTAIDVLVMQSLERIEKEIARIARALKPAKRTRR